MDAKAYKEEGNKAFQ